MSDLETSQSLLNSGQFLRPASKHIMQRQKFPGRNPFLIQVNSYEVERLIDEALEEGGSQSLLNSGQFLRIVTIL